MKQRGRKVPTLTMGRRKLVRRDWLEQLKAQGVNVEDVSAGSDGRGDKGPAASQGNTESQPHGRTACPRI